LIILCTLVISENNYKGKKYSLFMQNVETLLVIPMYNEEKIIKETISKTINYCNKFLSNYLLIIGNNGSTDKTFQIAKKLEKKYNNLIIENIDKKGRGNTLKFIWNKYNSKYYLYMDADLSTDLKFIKKIIHNLKNNDIVIGSRHLKLSQLKRSIYRDILSKGYNYFMKILFNTKIKDLQCGFKGFNKKIINELMPYIEDNNWFFDTEFLLKAEQKSYKIKEIPVKWIEKKDSKVLILDTIILYLKKSANLKKNLKP
jgi:glycosyltransferase involved in cell wall biosynthesis